MGGWVREAGGGRGNLTTGLIGGGQGGGQGGESSVWVHFDPPKT